MLFLRGNRWCWPSHYRSIAGSWQQTMCHVVTQMGAAFCKNSKGFCEFSVFSRKKKKTELGSRIGLCLVQRAPNPPEFAHPRLSRVKAWSSPARGYKFGCGFSYMAGHYPGILMTGHVGTNTPKFVPPCWGRPRFDPTQTGLCKFGWVWSSLIGSLTIHTPSIRGVEVHPLNSGRGLSKPLCFIVF